jgi:hypothetical protein
VEAGGENRLLRMGSARALDARSNPLHLIFTVQLHLLQLDFFQEVFGTKVGGRGEFLKFCIVSRVLLGEALILGVRIEKYVPRVPLQDCHAFLLMTDVNVVWLLHERKVTHCKAASRGKLSEFRLSL